ncbi:unnamed protein product [Allacma fusca]|uniref:Uncharacterized protein n=1 Tax=Allacma fusca TaxID=39272 RepID=A0A8J2K9G9_9HEXA|nr:unnamed protein product [Allacma fusca]
MTRLHLVNNATGLISDEDADRFLTNIIKPQFFDIGRVIIGGCIEDFDAVSEAERNEEFCHAPGTWSIHRSRWSPPTITCCHQPLVNRNRYSFEVVQPTILYTTGTQIYGS